MIFESDRLILKSTHVTDADLILELYNTPKWIQYIGDRNIHTIEAAESYITTKMTPQLDRLGYSNFTLIIKESQTKIGCCGLYDRDGIDGVDLGFALLPEYEGKGYGYEAATKILELAKTHWSITAVSAITGLDNVGSQKLLVKLGFQYIEEKSLGEERIKLFELSLPEKTAD